MLSVTRFVTRIASCLPPRPRLRRSAGRTVHAKCHAAGIREARAMFVTWNVGGHFLGGGWPGRSSRLTAWRAIAAAGRLRPISERLASPCICPGTTVGFFAAMSCRAGAGDVVARRLTNVASHNRPGVRGLGTDRRRAPPDAALGLSPRAVAVSPRARHASRPGSTRGRASARSSSAWRGTAMTCR